MTPVHPASYTTLMTIVAADVRTPITIIPVGTVIAVVPIGTVIAIIPIGTVIPVVAVPVAVIMSAIYTPIMPAVDAAIVGLRLVHGQ